MKRMNNSVVVAIGFSVVLSTVLIFFIISASRVSTEKYSDSISRLEHGYQREGIDGFQKEKSRIRSEVARQLSSDRALVSPAHNLAVYLFPELLRDDDFEKDIAEREWAPFQRSIEADPNSSQATHSFDELKANVFNYEVADKRRGELSPVANGMIRIYDALSRPSTVK